MVKNLLKPYEHFIETLLKPYENPIQTLFNPLEIRSGPRKTQTYMNLFRNRGSTFYWRFPAAGPPPTTWQVLSTIRDPGELPLRAIPFVSFWRLSFENSEGKEQCDKYWTAIGVSRLGQEAGPGHGRPGPSPALGLGP